MLHEVIGKADVSWAGKTYEGVRDRASQEGSILIVPVASLEQHGYHLPTATDTILGNAVAFGGAQRIESEVPVLISPPIWTGYSPHHLPFGGTVSLEFERLLHVLEDITATAAENGFDAILFLNSHVGNASIISSAVQTTGLSNDDVRMYGMTYLALAGPFLDEIRDSELGGVAHAGEVETSLMLHLRPELVDEDDYVTELWKLPYEYASAELLEPGPLVTYSSFEEYSDSGTLGDPTHASAEKGERLYEAYCDEVGSILLDVHDHLVADA
jgi:creatinine amidohydrolase